MATDTLPALGKILHSQPAVPGDFLWVEPGLELSVVIPCLNEVETLGACVRKARLAMEQENIAGEIIVADNGSHDGSPQLAQRLGVRVITVREKGYGCALRSGIAAARGRYVIMGDADDSYDFGEIPRFLAALRQGHDLVLGCRLPRGGGRVLPGAMPMLHRWLGNPLLSWIAQRLFAAPVHDIYCGLRGFSKRSYKRWGMECDGMEFAIEMVIKACLLKERCGELPITLHPDGRAVGRSHLRTFRDGWRSVRYLLQSRWNRRKLAALLAAEPSPRNASAGLFVQQDLREREGDRPNRLICCWDRLHTAFVHPRRVRVLSQRLAAWLPRGARVLDVGCGDGLLARAIGDQRPDLRLQGVEVKRRSPCHIACDEFDGRHLAFADRSLDVVLLIDVLHHTEDPLPLLREATRVARLGVVIKDHLLCGFGAGLTLRMMDRLGNLQHGVPLPFTYWTRHRWQQAFSELGLRAERWDERLTLYPWPASLLFDRSLHFVAALSIARTPVRTQSEAVASGRLAAPAPVPAWLTAEC